MAYMDQERKAILAAAVKAAAPAGWKYSLRVRDHSTIVMTITEAPVNILAAHLFRGGNGPETHGRVNPYYVSEQFAEGPVRDALVAIMAALNAGNHDRSDAMTDYADVGWYVDLNIGRWDRPFVVTEAVAA